MIGKTCGISSAYKGVATHDLPSYLGWRRMIEREDELARAQIVMQAV